MISLRVPNMNSTRSRLHKWPSITTRMHFLHLGRLAIYVLILSMVLLNPRAYAEEPPEPEYLTYLPLATRYYNPTRMIVFASTRTNTREIWVVSDDGSYLQQLTHLGGWNDYPAWSPDSGKVAFSSNRTDGSDDIYVMNSDGSSVVILTSNPNFSDREPSWSPDNQRIVFTRVLTNGNNSVLCIMNANGNNLVQLTEGWDTQPDWSPDNSRIAFTRNNDIYIISITGTNILNLTSGWGLASNESQPAWSPDGNKIAFVSNKGNDFISHIWLVNADGSGGFTQLTFDATDADHPAFSPDGQRIVYHRVENTATVSINMWIVNIGTKAVNRLTNTTHIDANPDW
jgi:Tol biopolymer transport system component